MSVSTVTAAKAEVQNTAAYFSTAPVDCGFRRNDGGYFFGNGRQEKSKLPARCGLWHENGLQDPSGGRFVFCNKCLGWVGWSKPKISRQPSPLSVVTPAKARVQNSAPHLSTASLDAAMTRGTGCSMICLMRSISQLRAVKEGPVLLPPLPRGGLGRGWVAAHNPLPTSPLAGGGEMRVQHASLILL